MPPDEGVVCQKRVWIIPDEGVITGRGCGKRRGKNARDSSLLEVANCRKRITFDLTHLVEYSLFFNFTVLI